MNQDWWITKSGKIIWKQLKQKYKYFCCSWPWKIMRENNGFFYWAGCIFSQSTLTEVGISLLKHFRFQSTLRVFSINFLTKVLISWCTSIYSIWIHEGIKMGCNNIHKFKKYEKRIFFFVLQPYNFWQPCKKTW